MDVLDRVAAATVEAMCLRAEAVSGGEVFDADGLVVALTNLPAAHLNVVVVDHEPADPPRALATAEEAFRSRGHPFFGIDLEAGRHPAVEDAVRLAGLQRLVAREVLATTVEALPEAAEVDGVEVEAVTSEADIDIDAVRKVDLEAFGGDVDIVTRFVGPRMLRDPRVRMWLARADGLPVGESSAYHLGDTVGVFGVGVIDGYRRRGIGTLLTVLSARTFRSVDLAWLQPLPGARGIYDRLGFEPVSTWEIWERPR
jgi:GNAT superfamily N-acetyltransferase